MRIVAGRYRGRRLTAPPGSGTRPILDRAKVALFDWLGARLARPGELPPLHVLDLFCGAGSLGIEALSRGAQYCCFVDNDAAALRCLRQNLVELGIVERVAIIQGSAESAPIPPCASGYGLIFLDPPYAMSVDQSANAMIARVLRRLARDVLLAPGARLVWRYERGYFNPGVVPDRWLPPECRSWGTIEVAVYEWPEPGTP